MEKHSLYCAGTSPAVQYAKIYLRKQGFPVHDTLDRHCEHILLDVPSFRPGSFAASSGNLDALLASLPDNTVIWGGGLNNPVLKDYICMDLLLDEQYLARNALITAHCAIGIAAQRLPITFHDCPVLIAGWGRIGKCLGKLLKGLGSDVTVASRHISERSILRTLGYRTADYIDLPDLLPNFRLIINTVPELILPESIACLCRNCVKIDLASRKGISGEDVLWARGLPGIHAPESSGELIAETVCRRIKELTK